MRTSADKFVPLKYAPCGVILNLRQITAIEYTPEKLTENVKKHWIYPEDSGHSVVQAFIDWIAGRESSEKEDWMREPEPYYEVYTPGEWIKMTHKELEETFRPSVNYKLVLSVQPDADKMVNRIFKSWEVYDNASLVIGTTDGAKFYIWGDDTQVLRARTMIVDRLNSGEPGTLDLDEIQSKILNNGY